MAQIRIRDAGGTLRTISRIRVRDADNNLRTILRIRVRDATNVLRTVYESMTASASPDTLTGTAATVVVTTTDPSVVTVTGGTSPYTYLWSPAPYNVDGVQPSSPTAASTKFRASISASGGIATGDFFCTVTDATGATAITGTVNVELDRT